MNAQSLIANLHERVSSDELMTAALVVDCGPTFSLVWDSDPHPAVRLARLIEEGGRPLGYVAYKGFPDRTGVGVAPLSELTTAADMDVLTGVRDMLARASAAQDMAARVHTTNAPGKDLDPEALERVVMHDRWRDES